MRAWALQAAACAGFLALVGPVWANLLDNPGFEQAGPEGQPAGWTVLNGLDANEYGPPENRQRFDEVRPVVADGGRAGSNRSVAFPASGIWLGKIQDHTRPASGEGPNGAQFGKAALVQTVRLEPGVYRFGAWLRTVEGDAYTAAFSLGWNAGEPAAFANDSSTGITWTRDNLGLKTSFDGTGTMRARGEWTRYETEPFEVASAGPHTVWIRFNFANNNSMRTRWEVDDAFVESVEPAETPAHAEPAAPVERSPEQPRLSFPMDGQVVVDCGDQGERYLLDGGSRVRGEVPYNLFQHARAVRGQEWFGYRIPLDHAAGPVYLAFEHMGPVRVTCDGVTLVEDTEAAEDRLYPKQVKLEYPELWPDGTLNLRFESADPAREAAVVWVEAGATTRYQQRIRNVEWFTRDVLWTVGLWDGSSNEFRGSRREVDALQGNAAALSTNSWAVRWNQPEVKPGSRYWLLVGHIRTGAEDSFCKINIGDDDSVEYVSRISGAEVVNLDVTQWLREGANVAAITADSLDFAALVESGPDSSATPDHLQLYFGGDGFAANVSRVLHNTLFWILDLHYDDSGFIDASIPHGKWWNQYWPIDIAFALRALLFWGFDEQAERAANLVAQVAWEGHQSNRSGGSDNNGGSILSMDLCEIIRRRGFRAETVENLWPQVQRYSDQLCQQAEAGAFGLIKGTNWENAGNLQQGASHSLSTNLMAVWALRKAADTAEEGGLEGNVDRWRRTADEVRRQVLERLVFQEDVESPTGWTFPAGTWAYGLMDDGSYMLQPLAGYFWAGELGTSAFGFVDPDREVRRLYSMTEDAAMPLFDTGHRGLVSGYAISYDGPGAVFGSAALSDRVSLMDRLLDEFQRNTDYGTDLDTSISEVSRWAEGSHEWVEDTNLVGAAEYLNWPRYIVGIDDILYQGEQLRIVPRLPSRWDRCGVNRWKVQYLEGSQRKQTELTFDYRHSESATLMRLQSADGVRGLKIRLGPFDSDRPAPGLRVDGRAVSPVEEISGEGLWLWVTLDTRGGREHRVEALAD